MGVVPRLETEEQREFWAFVEETAKEVRSWPGWMRGERDEPNDTLTPKLTGPAASRDYQTTIGPLRLGPSAARG